MSIILPFIFGFLAAFVGVLPPGLINMTAAKVSLVDGKKQAMMFIFGALTIVVLQTYLAVIFAKYIDKHQEVVVTLREVGCVIFIILTIYFLFFAKTPSIKHQDEIKIKSKRSRFFMGVIILITITLASYNVFSYEIIQNSSLIIGIVLGSFCVFYFYIVFFNKMKSKATFFVSKMNTIIGIITGLIALLTLINILKYYY
jgi:threonine/homoserine/homoserine lactone efflux protein